MNKTVLYLRSSKDRHDVSIDAQRGELEKLAAERGLVVIGEFSDPVERADDGDRPGLRGLLHELKSRARKWNVIIMLDTSRLARQDQAFALLFDRECEKHGVKVIYKMLPEGYGVMDKFFMSTVRSFDMLHSLLSKQKGVAGLAENIKQGHRAGGRAPFGYRLVHEEKGVIREGLPVMKSRLELSEDAPRIAAYLRDRAAGVPRIRARQKAGIHELSDTTLIGIEWNAVTYAGSTVWNAHNEFKKDIGYVGGTKRKPRKDWLIKEGTHPALITAEEAETILSRLEAKSKRRVRASEHIYLLSGLVATPDGQAWHGDRGHYRAGKGRKIDAHRVEQAVLQSLSTHVNSESAVEELLQQIQAMYRMDGRDEEFKRLETQIRVLTRNIERLSALLAETTAPQALLRSIETWETERTALLDRISALQVRAAAAEGMRKLTKADIRRHLARLAEDLDQSDREGLRDALRGLIESVELDPETYACEVRWRVTSAKRRGKVASPRGFEPRLSP